MPVTEKTADALATSVMTIDAARRVGWAKAFDEQQKNDDLSRENNMLREERDAYRHGLSFLFGVVIGLVDDRSSTAKAMLAAETAGYDLIIDRDAKNAGRRQALTLQMLDGVADEMAEAKAQRRRAQARSKTMSSHWFASGRRRERDLIRRRFGFRTTTEMMAVLRKWQQATGRAPLMGARQTRRFDAEATRKLGRDLRRLARDTTGPRSDLVDDAQDLGRMAFDPEDDD